MSALHIMRGLPASGKSTWAKAWVAEDAVRRARVNRDALRSMMHDGAYIKGGTESQIITVEHLAITGLLESGKDVVVDDTNLPSRTVKQLMALARDAGAVWVVHDLTDVPVETCIERDAKRYDGADPQASVGEEVIRRMYQQYVKSRAYPLPVPELPQEAPLTIEPYVTVAEAHQAILVDMDGTLALMNGRGAYDESKVCEDLPNQAVVEAVVAAHQMGLKIVVMSGRTEGSRRDTEIWQKEVLGLYGVEVEAMFMRSVGDRRPDWMVKLELFNAHVRNRYNVRYVLDDRDQVVNLWRRLGLTCFQVAPGNF
jgi:predicted kinase